MKKLMLTAAAAALVGGAFAQNIFDYKASVKYVDFKYITGYNDDGAAVKNGNKIAIKVVKSATLTGYLVTPVDCPCEDVPDRVSSACTRYGEAPSFLVIQNRAQANLNRHFGFSNVKLMPANLLTDWWFDANNKGLGRPDIPSYDSRNQKTVNLKAQGYLFAGVGKRDVPDPVLSPNYGLGDNGNNASITKLRTAATQMMFGLWNSLDVVDGTINDQFIEPFLDQSGFGTAKYTYGVTKAAKKAPCVLPGVDDPDHKICLVSLSGTLIGGSFDCIANGAVVQGSGYDMCISAMAGWAYAEDYICQDWDVVQENAFSIGGSNNIPQVFANPYMYNVISGTWSIKASKLTSTCSEKSDVEMCINRLDSSRTLYDFDVSNRSELNTFAGNFYRKWFTNVK